MTTSTNKEDDMFECGSFETNNLSSFPRTAIIKIMMMLKMTQTCVQKYKSTHRMIRLNECLIYN
jgi:3'-phosphoadenosine 5'-phosphosulfate sulfotransferase